MTRLKLRDDAYYAPTSDGICILSNSGEVVLTGPSIFRWIDQLAPYLDGRYTLADLTASMPADRRDMTERIINALCEQRVVVITGECPTDATLLAEGAGRAGQRDPDQQITRPTVDPADEERLSDVVAGAGIVIYASDRAAVDRARMLDRVCGRAGIPFVSAILAGEEAWLGPFGPVTDGPGWISGWRRLLALNGTGGGRLSHASAGPDGPAAPRGDLYADAAPTVVANQRGRPG